MKPQREPSKQERAIHLLLDRDGSDGSPVDHVPPISDVAEGASTNVDTISISQSEIGTGFSSGSVPVTSRLLWRIFCPVGTNLETLRGATSTNIPDIRVRSSAIRKELITIGDYVMSLVSDPECTEDDRDCFWTFVAAYWPVAGATGAHIRSVYEGIDRQMQAEVENDKPEPFLETAFDRLAPELREQLEEMESRAAPAREV